MVRPGPVDRADSATATAVAPGDQLGREMNRKRVAEESILGQPLAKKLSTTPPPRSPVEEDRNSSASTAEKEEDDDDYDSQHSDGDMPNGNFCEEEVDAASSLAHIFMTAKGRTPATKKQPNSAPAALESPSSNTNGEGADPLNQKKQRRREKNRESAQQSRQRKKMHLESLEHRVAELEKERAALQTHLESLESENTRLKTKLAGAGVKADPEPVAPAPAPAPAPTNPNDEARGADMLAQLAKAALA